MVDGLHRSDLYINVIDDDEPLSLYDDLPGFIDNWFVFDDDFHNKIIELIARGVDENGIRYRLGRAPMRKGTIAYKVARCDKPRLNRKPHLHGFGEYRILFNGGPHWMNTVAGYGVHVDRVFPELKHNPPKILRQLRRFGV
jgi:hypothetical protein